MIDTTTPISSVTYNGTSIPLASGSQGEFKVEFRDIDGTLLKTEFVNSGDSVTPPATPTFDSDYLEFDYWAVSGGDSLSNITRDTLVMPQYKTKQDNSINNERPTYLIGQFTGEYFCGLSPILEFYSYSNTNIDWGDNTIDTVSASTASHTYTTPGTYIIKIYGDSYQIGGNGNYGFFNTGDNGSSLIKVYMGEHHGNFGYDRGIYQQFSMKYLVLPSHITSIGTLSICAEYSLLTLVIPSTVTDIGRYHEGNGSLRYLIIPSGTTSLGDRTFENCYNLKSLSLPHTITTIGSYCFRNSYNLEILNLPNSLSSIKANSFTSCYTLKELNLPLTLTSIGLNGRLGTTVFSAIYPVKSLILPNNFNFSMDLYLSNLSKESLKDIANKLKDNTGLTAKTIKFSYGIMNILKNTCLDANGNEVPYGTVGANNLETIIANKNWTLSYVSYTG